MDRAKKQDFVSELTEKLAEAQCVYLTDFTGLDVERLTQLRSKLRASSVEYVVVKNTLARRAIAGTTAAGLEELLSGPSAFAVGRSDVVAAAKVLTDFSKDADVPRIKGGVVAGRIVSVGEIRRLATLPGREVLLGQVLGTMKAPIGGFVHVLAGLLAKFVRTVDALRAQRAEGAASAAPESSTGAPADAVAAAEPPASEASAAEAPASEASAAEAAPPQAPPAG